MSVLKLKIGNELSTEVAIIDTNNHCRTPQQMATFFEFAKTGDIMFLCNNPFEVDFIGEKYNRTFQIVYYNRTGNMCYFNLTPRGKTIKNYNTTTNANMTKYGMSDDIVEQMRLREVTLVTELNNSLGIYGYNQLI